MTRRIPLASILVLLTSGLAGAQEPCPEFRVNTYTTGHQSPGSIAADANGNFVVVWTTTNPEVTDSDTMAQRFSAAGERRGPEFRVNTYTTADQNGGTVASDPGGNFVVVWNSSQQDAGTFGIFGQRFDAIGTPQGAEFQLNSYTTANQGNPVVASDAAGNFVAAWINLEVPGGPTDTWEVRARQFSAAGVPRGPDFQVNTHTTHIQGLHIDVASDAAGNFVVVWDSYNQDGFQWGVFGQRFDAAGVPQGPEFQVNTYTFSVQVAPSVAFGLDGSFVVVWESAEQDGDGHNSIFGQRFDAGGVRQGPEFAVNSYTPQSQTRPQIASDASGDFVVFWSSYGQDGSDAGVFGRRVSSAGIPQGPDFRVNTYTTGVQRDPKVARGTRGGAVVAWSGEPGDAFASLECSRLYPVTPCRVVDTRFPPGLPLAANTSRTFPVSGSCDIPADARAVAFNLTAVNPTEVGNLRLYPAGQPAPMTSTVNFAAGLTRANNAIALLGTGGQVTVQCDMPPGTPGTTHLVLDVSGYFKR